MKSRLLAILASVIFLTACGGEGGNNNTLSFSRMSDAELESYVATGLIFGNVGIAMADVPNDPAVNPSAALLRVVDTCESYSSSGNATSGTSTITLNGCSELGYTLSAELSSTWSVGDTNTFSLTGFMSFSGYDAEVGSILFELSGLDITVTENTLNNTGTLDMNYAFLLEGGGERFAFSVETTSIIVVNGIGVPQSGTVVISDGSATITVTYDPNELSGYTYTVN